MGAARVGRLRRTDGRVIESFEQYSAFALLRLEISSDSPADSAVIARTWSLRELCGLE